MTDLGLLLAVWISLSVVFDIFRQIRIQRSAHVSRGYWAMQLAHLGVAFTLAGIAVVCGYESEKDVKLNPGETIVTGGYSFRFQGVTPAAGPNYQAARATVDVGEGDRVVGRMYPEKRIYNASGNAVTSSAIDSGFVRDLYVSIGESTGSDGSWSMRVYYKPLVNWIWGGAALMAAGGVIAFSSRRRTGRTL
jgi:cytochrome c-type biogenesis protein CcmF